MLLRYQKLTVCSLIFSIMTLAYSHHIFSAVASEATAITDRATTAKSYVILADDIFPAIHSAITQHRLDATKIDLDSLIASVMGQAIIDPSDVIFQRSEVRRTRYKGTMRHYRQSSFLYQDRYYYFDNDQRDNTWYAADVVNQVLLAELTKLQPATTIERHDGIDIDHITTIAHCGHKFHRGCLATNTDFQVSQRKLPYCIACPSATAAFDPAHVVVTGRLILPRGAAAPRCWVCLDDLPARPTRFGDIVGGTLAKTYADVVRVAEKRSRE